MIDWCVNDKLTCKLDNELDDEWRGSGSHSKSTFDCHNFISCPILIPNWKFSWAISYSTMHFGGTYAKIYACYERKKRFLQCVIWEFGGSLGG